MPFIGTPAAADNSWTRSTLPLSLSCTSSLLPPLSSFYSSR